MADKMELVQLSGALKLQGTANITVQELLDRTIRRPQLRRLMTAFARTYVYSAALDLVSADVFVDKFRRSLKQHPVHYIDGGWQTLVDILRHKAEQAGARILRGNRVEAVDIQNGRAQGVRLHDGSLLRANAVIIATEPKAAVKLIDEKRYPALRQIVDALIPAQAACIDVALSRLSSTQHLIVQDLDHPRFLSTQSCFARIAPEGGAMISAFKQLDPTHPTDVRWLQADEEEVVVQSPRAYLSTIVVRLCIDQSRSARAQREVYVGSWLPEPILTTEQQQQQEPGDAMVRVESLSFAFLMMLERLGPLERAVFLLREIFDYDYAEIAEIVGKSQANCRQILHRAQQHLGKHNPRFEVSREQQERITTKFLHATFNGDMQGLLNLLAEDVVFTADTGGKVPGARKSIVGPDNVTRGSLGALRWLPSGIEARIREVNGLPAIVGYLDGRAYGAILLDVEGERVHRIYTVLNPDKLRWLGEAPE